MKDMQAKLHEDWRNGDPKWHHSLLADTEVYVRATKSPSIKGLAQRLGVSRQTVYNWTFMYPQFRLLVHELRHRQITDMPMWGCDRDYPDEAFPKL